MLGAGVRSKEEVGGVKRRRYEELGGSGSASEEVTGVS